jgi:flagellar biosynthesis component FlhA
MRNILLLLIFGALLLFIAMNLQPKKKTEKPRPRSEIPASTIAEKQAQADKLWKEWANVPENSTQQVNIEKNVAKLFANFDEGNFTDKNLAMFVFLCKNP